MKYRWLKLEFILVTVIRNLIKKYNMTYEKIPEVQNSAFLIRLILHLKKVSKTRFNWISFVVRCFYAMQVFKIHV